MHTGLLTLIILFATAQAIPLIYVQKQVPTFTIRHLQDVVTIAACLTPLYTMARYLLAVASNPINRPSTLLLGTDVGVMTDACNALHITRIALAVGIDAFTARSCLNRGGMWPLLLGTPNFTERHLISYLSMLATAVNLPIIVHRHITDLQPSAISYAVTIGAAIAAHHVVPRYVAAYYTLRGMGLRSINLTKRHNIKKRA